MNRRTLQRLTAGDVSVWLDPDATVEGNEEDLTGWIAENAVTGVGPSLPAVTPGLGDGGALSVFGEADPLRARALSDSTRLAARLAAQLAGVHAATGGCDGLVQFPAPPDIWNDAAALVAIGADVAAVTSAPNVMVGVPCNAAGLAAVPELILRGVSVAVGPVFSPSDGRRARAAYRSGLERRLAGGRALDAVTSVAWIPMGVIDDYAAGHLDARRPELMRSVGAAVAELIYLESFRALADAQWQPLRAAGATRQRPAFCHLRGVADGSDFQRLVLPGSILALAPEDIAAIDTTRSLPLAEPDETEATWALQQAARGGLRLGAMSRELRVRFEARSWRAWWLRLGGAGRPGPHEPRFPPSHAAGCWP